MPRRARHYIADQPYHIVQRGNNRAACFMEPENYQCYLNLWRELADRYGVKVHAFCLMTNHIHFLATPTEATSLSNTLKVVGSRYAQYINVKYKRTGTLWEGRHRASLIQSERYLLICYRYIELNAVRAGMVKRPEAYAWSSYMANAWEEKSWLVPHQEYLRLGEDRSGRAYAYRELFRSALVEDDLHLLRKATHYNYPVGDDGFCQAIEEKYGITLGNVSRGRPRKKMYDK
ncbi:transposase [Exilibacterium tricleocarpae]|uniref:Transposase n=1 Tax=Exilibacterium tricleocarpae TaxID=2591008 RepID=A0A545TM21_9GAMM|nr:transposase [Exilibacterium tricleocarpae]TQV78279.1 transposase [Exilibacterium tricleocarpae]